MASAGHIFFIGAIGLLVALALVWLIYWWTFRTASAEAYANE